MLLHTAIFKYVHGHVLNIALIQLRNPFLPVEHQTSVSSSLFRVIFTIVYILTPIAEMLSSSTDKEAPQLLSQGPEGGEDGGRKHTDTAKAPNSPYGGLADGWNRSHRSGSSAASIAAAVSVQPPRQRDTALHRAR